MAVKSRIISQHELWRRQRGLSVTELARQLACSHTYASRIEGGKVPASPRYRTAVARLLRVDEEILFDERGWSR